MKTAKKKLALVLSGGGFNGAFQLGALNYIKENWKTITGLDTPMKFDIIAGVSTGALNGSLMAMNQLDVLNDLWLHQIGKKGVTEIYTSDFLDTSGSSDKLKLNIDLKSAIAKLFSQVDFKLSLPKKLGLIFSKQKRKDIIKEVLLDVEQQIKKNIPTFRAIADNTPLKKKLEKYLDRSLITGTKFLCGFVSLNTGLYHSVIHDQFLTEQDFIHGVLASAAIPMVWKPVPKIQYTAQGKEITSLSNVDGGIRNVSPLGDVINQINQDTDECEYKIIVINCSSGKTRGDNYARKSIAAIASRSLYEIAFAEIFDNDVNHFITVNNLLKQAEAWDGDIVLHSKNNQVLKPFDAVIISPDKDVELGSALVANEKLIRFRTNHGYTQAENAFKEKDFNNG